MSFLDKFKRKKTDEELLKEELIAEMRNELNHMKDLGRGDVYDVQIRSEHLDRLDKEAKLLNGLKSEDLKKIESKTEARKGIVPAIIGAVATMASASILILFEKDECITGNAAKELLRKIFSGFNRK